MSYHGLVCVYKDSTWNRDDNEKTFDIVEFDLALTPEDYKPDEPIRSQAPIKITRVRATSKSEIEKYEDQGLWLCFVDHRPDHWWYPTRSATFEAKELGWTSW
jgi:hypothetical protein